MDGIINEKSLDAQFDTLDDFFENLSGDILKMLKYFKIIGKKVYKKQDLYDYFVTNDHKLSDVLCMSRNRNPLIERLKSIVAEIMYDPYWEDEIESGESKSSFDAAKDMNCLLISFKHEDFCKEYIEHCDSELSNCYDNNSTVNHFYKNSLANESFYYQNLDLGLSISFLLIENREYTQEAFNDSGFTYEDKLRISEKTNKLFSCIIKKSPFTDVAKHLESGLYEFRCDVSYGRIFRLFFFISDQGLQFLNGFIKKSQKTPSQQIANAKKLMDFVKQ